MFPFPPGFSQKRNIRETIGLGYDFRKKMQLDGSSSIGVSVVWRAKRFVVEMSPSASLNELGKELQKLTGVSEDTMRLLIPKSSASGSKVVYPFADEQKLSLREASVQEGKYIRMMGATKDEVDDIIKNEKANLRIAGFEEEERRLRQRMSAGPRNPIKLPQGTYIFCEFRTLDLPGVKLNPPPSEALKRMHQLAADPGIVAVMNKHRWRVGIMSEMAPEGYVGISSVCILGYNKNQGEEISLRLRTDDLKGFRKYEVIKKTLLHELAHMVYSEHDTNFHALNSQLNKEASSLDWTRSRSHTLSNSASSAHYEEDFDAADYGGMSQKLGGDTSGSGLPTSARLSSVAAAYNRLANRSVSEVKDTDASPPEMDEEHRSNAETILIPQLKGGCNSDLDCSGNETQSEIRSDPDPSAIKGNVNSEPYDDSQAGAPMSKSAEDKDKLVRENTLGDLDQNDANSQPNSIRGLEDSLDGCCLSNGQRNERMESEPDPDDSLINCTAPDLHWHSVHLNNTTRNSMDEPNLGDQGIEIDTSGSAMSDEIIAEQERSTRKEPNPCDISDTFAGDKQTEVSLNDCVPIPIPIPIPIPMDIYEPDPDDEEMKRIQDPAMIFCHRIRKAVDSLHSEVKPGNIGSVLKTLAKIISNVLEHPNEMKFKRLRKANPAFARNIANHKAAMEILSLIGFQEDIAYNDIGSFESYLVLKRNDPGLLWLAKSSLEAYFS